MLQPEKFGNPWPIRPCASEKFSTAVFKRCGLEKRGRCHTPDTNVSVAFIIDFRVTSVYYFIKSGTKYSVHLFKDEEDHNHKGVIGFGVFTMAFGLTLKS